MQISYEILIVYAHHIISECFIFSLVGARGSADTLAVLEKGEKEIIVVEQLWLVL